MKIIIWAALALMLLHSCNNSPKKKDPEPAIVPQKQVVEKSSFFPVTDYLLGQIYEITQRGINPIKYSTVNNHTDSAWLKTEELQTAFYEFLHPQIDSVNLISLFTEKKFMDQTIDALTFTYDPVALLPDSMTLQHWDVYIDPKTGKVRRIYMVKTIDETKTLQLTWQGDKWCKLVHITNKPDGTSFVEKEEKITWDL